MNQLIVFQNSNGTVDIFERTEDTQFNRVTYIRRSFEMIEGRRNNSGVTGVLVGLAVWLLRDSAVSGYHWILGLLLNY